MDQIFHKLTRREMLKTATCGFGGLALSGMHNGEAASPILWFREPLFFLSEPNE